MTATMLTDPPRASELLISLLTAVRRPSIPAVVPVPAPVTGHEPEGPAVRLTAAHRPPVELEQVLAHRNSFRFFSPEPLDGEVLTAALEDAVADDRHLWSAQGAGTTIVPLVAALRVRGLRPGLYRYADGGYVPLAPLTADDVAAMVLQTEFADAPVIVAAMGSIEAALAGHADHGFRLLTTRAATTCYSVLLTAYHHGLIGSVFAGFLSSGLAAHLRIDSYHQAQLFAAALGHPAPQSSQPSDTA